jgi:hypothetical protein
LIYTYYKWSEAEKNEWFSMPHIDRLYMLNASAGWITPVEPIIPIKLIWGEKEPHDAVWLLRDRPSPVTLCLLAQGAFLGFTAEMCGPDSNVRVYETKNRVTEAYPRKIGDENIQRLRRPTGDDVARGLKTMFEEGGMNSQNIFSCWDALARVLLEKFLISKSNAAKFRQTSISKVG